MPRIHFRVVSTSMLVRTLQIRACTTVSLLVDEKKKLIAYLQRLDDKRDDLERVLKERSESRYLADDVFAIMC